MTQHPIVKLNVGGERFMTTRHTLEARPDSFFTRLFSTNVSVVTDDQGFIFIDRSPVYFEPILQFMRTGILICPPSLDPQMLEMEAEFYGIVPPPQPKQTSTPIAFKNPRNGFGDSKLIQYLSELNSSLDNSYYLQHQTLMEEIEGAIFEKLARLAEMRYKQETQFYIFFMAPPQMPHAYYVVPPLEKVYIPVSSSRLAIYQLPDDSQTIISQEIANLLDIPETVNVLLEHLKKKHSLSLQHKLTAFRVILDHYRLALRLADTPLQHPSACKVHAFLWRGGNTDTVPFE